MGNKKSVKPPLNPANINNLSFIIGVVRPNLLERRPTPPFNLSLSV